MSMRNAPVFLDPGIRLFLDRRSTLSRDRPRNTTSMLEILVRRVDNRIHFFYRDVACDHLNRLI
jgi:hypothetical protein